MIIVADSVATATPKMGNVFGRIVEKFRAPALNALAYLSGAHARRADAIAADAQQDRCHILIVRGAALGAQEAEIRGCGCAPRFDRLLVLAQQAQHFDALEDAADVLAIQLNAVIAAGLHIRKTRGVSFERIAAADERVYEQLQAALQAEYGPDIAADLWTAALDRLDRFLAQCLGPDWQRRITTDREAAS